MVAGILVSLLIATQIHKRFPLNRLMDLCHIFFLPAIAIMLREFPNLDLLTPYGAWLTFSLSLMSICVLIDAFDLYWHCVQGKRSYTD